MFRAKVKVMLKRSIADPEGAAMDLAFENLGLLSMQNARVGKCIEFDVGVENREEAEKQVDAVCVRLLANSAIEAYEFSLEMLK